MTALALLIIFLLGWLVGYMVSAQRPREVERFQIATAPRDGTLIKLWFGRDCEPSVGWYDPAMGEEHYRWKFMDSQTPVIETRFINTAIDAPGGPSHWAPL